MHRLPMAPIMQNSKKTTAKPGFCSTKLVTLDLCVSFLT